MLLEFEGIVGVSFAVHNQHGVMVGLSDASHNLWRNERHGAAIWEFEVMEIRSEVTLRKLEFYPLRKLVSYLLDRVICNDAVEGKD